MQVLLPRLFSSKEFQEPDDPTCPLHQNAELQKRRRATRVIADGARGTRIEGLCARVMLENNDDDANGKWKI